METFKKAKLSDLTIGAEFYELILGVYRKQFPVRKRLDKAELAKYNITWNPKEETEQQYRDYKEWLRNGVNRFYIKTL